MSENKKNKEQSKGYFNKIFGATFIILALAIASVFLIFNSNNAKEKENNVLQETNKELKKSNKNKEDIIERLDKKNVDKEQKETRKIGEKFINILFINDPKKLVTDKHDDAKKVMTNKLADKYFGKKDPMPNRYETKIKNLNIYDDRYSPAKDNYKMFATFKQLSNEPDGSISMQQDMVIELNLKQTKDGWKVEKFKQIAGQDNRSK
ncbi:TPA: hypothetical protein ACKFTO_002739 [Staphylococcus aureus]